MGLIGTPVALLSIANCEAFVQRTIDRSTIRFAPAEREELLAEGLAILYELADSYAPGLGGREASTSTFDGYAAMFLPRRLGDAWHKSHPEHRYVTDPDTGRRGWVYGAPMVSLNGLTDSPEGGDHHLRFAHRVGDFIQAASLGLSRSRIPSAGRRLAQ
jgi:hypothetical protein